MARRLVLGSLRQSGHIGSKSTSSSLLQAALSGFSPSVLDVLRRAAFKAPHTSTVVRRMWQMFVSQRRAFKSRQAILHSLPRNPLDPEPWRILSEQQVSSPQGAEGCRRADAVDNRVRSFVAAFPVILKVSRTIDLSGSKLLAQASCPEPPKSKDPETRRLKNPTEPQGP